MNQRVYGLLGIGSKMANWNAGMDGNPRSLYDGTFFGSDKALKYSMKKHWFNNDEKVLYIKTMKIEKDKLQPRELKERYKELFADLTKKTPSHDVLTNLLSAIDVKNFGATFAVEDHNIGITGAVQVGQGINMYEDADVQRMQILSPFRNSNKADAEATSLGEKLISDEAHYVYPFSVNPANYKDLEEVIKGFEGYEQEDYATFKDTALISATALQTNSKAGCYNEFAMFIELKEGSLCYLPHLQSYISFSKEEEKVVYDITKIGEMLQSFENEIEKVEVYYDPFHVEVSGNAPKLSKMNIFTKETV